MWMSLVLDDIVKCWPRNKLCIYMSRKTQTRSFVAELHWENPKVLSINSHCEQACCSVVISGCCHIGINSKPQLDRMTLDLSSRNQLCMQGKYFHQIWRFFTSHFWTYGSKRYVHRQMDRQTASQCKMVLTRGREHILLCCYVVTSLTAYIRWWRM